MLLYTVHLFITTRCGTLLGADCLGLAKAGQLVLNDGLWNGSRYLPAEYIEQLRTAPATKASPSYGLFWHLNVGDFYLSCRESNFMRSRPHGKGRLVAAPKTVTTSSRVPMLRGRFLLSDQDMSCPPGEPLLIAV